MKKLEKLQNDIMKSGGFVNAHAHLDRANTANYFTFKEQHEFLKEKWKLVDLIKSNTSKEKYKARMHEALDSQVRMGVSTVMSFIDIDNVVGEKAIDAACEVKEERKDIRLLTACQTLKGVINPRIQTIIIENIEKFDIIGSLPSADRDPNSHHLDIVMGWAKEYGKRLHVHVDQLNTPEERETELLSRKTMQYGLEGQVTAVHGISIASHKKSYREEVYKMCNDAGVSFITCPSAWIDHPRREDLVPSHNAVTPVDELLEWDLTVAIGSDNIHDIYKPYCDGNMMFELRLLLESCKIYVPEVLLDIATTNGKKVLGVM